MFRRLLRFFWIVLVLDWRYGIAGNETTQSATVILDAKFNGKINPKSIEIIATTMNENDSDMTTEYSIKNILSDSLIAEEAKENDTMTANIIQTTDSIQEKSNDHHTTKRSINFTKPETENPELPLEEAKKPSRNNNSLFLDMAMAGSNPESISVPLTDEGAKDVVTNGLEKHESREKLSDMSMDVVTEISIQETIGGQTVKRKPTEEELRLVESKLLEDSDKYNEIFAQDGVEGEKPLSPDENGKTNSSSPTNNGDPEDFVDFLKGDAGFVEDGEDADLFGEWGDDGDDINDMESILEHEFENHDEERMRFDNNDDGGTEAKSDKDKERDYRKFYHTERQNFTNVKEVKIVISETEGDFFDDDENKSSEQPQVKESVNATLNNITQLLLNETNNLLTTTTENYLTTISANLSEGLLTEPPQNEDSKSDSSDTVSTQSFNKTTIIMTKTKKAENPTLASTDHPPFMDNMTIPPPANATTVATFNNSNSTIKQIIDLPKNITIVEISMKSERNETAKRNPEISGPQEQTTDNGMNISDFSEITSLVENSYREIKNSDTLNETTKPNDVKNGSNSDDHSSVSIRFSTELTHNVTSLNSTFEDVEDTTMPDDYSTTDTSATIPADTSTVNIYGEENKDTTTMLISDNEETTTTVPELNTISTKLYSVSSVGEETTQVSTLSANSEIPTTIVTDNNNYSSPMTTSKEFTNAATLQQKNDLTTETIKIPETSESTIQGLKISTIINITNNNNNNNNSNIIKDGNVTFYEITPSEVESILNAKIKEYESIEDHDYVSKENVGKGNGWTVFEDKKNINKEKVQINSSLAESEKEQSVEDGFEDFEFLATLEEDGQRVQMLPILKVSILNNSVEFSVKISKEDDTFFVPSTAHIIENENMINITWRVDTNQNNSVALKLSEADGFYMIKEIIVNLFRGNKFVSQQKPVAFSPDPILDDTMPGRTRVVMMRDGTYITFSNVEFLKSANRKRENSEASTRNQRLWHFEVASVCVATVIMVAIVLYVIAIKTKAKITLSEKDELPQENQRLFGHCFKRFW